MDPVVTTIKDRCRRCYSCVRRCPAKAIRVHAGQADILTERCIACGRCVRVCSQNAKRVVDTVSGVRQLLDSASPVLMLAPSFVAAFSQYMPGQVVSAARQLGFAGVYEVAFGADLVSRALRNRYAANPNQLVITSPCPAAVGYIQKYAVELLPYLSPVLSPMAALGKVLKQRLRPGCATVFAGPCTAKIREALDGQVRPYVDAVMTFPELQELISQARIDPARLPQTFFDPPHSLYGGVYPIPGGLTRVAELPSDLLDSNIIEINGIDAFCETIERLRRACQSGDLQSQDTRYFDVLFCKGCISGPAMPGTRNRLARKERVVQYVRARRQAADRAAFDRALAELQDVDVTRSFAADNQRRPKPSEEQIREILARTNKHRVEDELNCRACGYPSCRDKAIAVFHGVAELEMCLPYLIEQLVAAVAQLNKSHEDLRQAHAQLLRSERLASMGQLAAGIAHEVNNPLGTILIYAHLLQEAIDGAGRLEPGDLREDVSMILAEATRCKSIVAGLLDFARQNKVTYAQVDVAALIYDAVRLVRVQCARPEVVFEVSVPSDLPPVWLDRDQMLQVLLNLVRNAAEVTSDGGQVSVRAQVEGGELKIAVRDSGPGIPAQVMPKLFTPFFTTKPQGRGTGLGLPISYGIVKMHRGSIVAQNNDPDPGATFEVCLPAVRDAAGAGEPSVRGYQPP